MAQPESLLGTYRFDVDAATSRITFRAKAFGVRWVTGSLLVQEGSVELNDGLLSAHGVADARTISTGLRVRDWHLRHPHYLDAARHSEVRLDVPPTPLEATSTLASLTVRGARIDVPLERITLSITADGTLRAKLAGSFDRSGLPMLPPAAGVSRVIHVELDAVAQR